MRRNVDPQLVETISQVPLFAKCSRRQQQLIAANATHMQKAAGDTIVEQGVSGIAFFVILSGQVRIEQDGVAVATLEPGAYFGELALLADMPRNADATAVTDVELAAYTQWAFKSVIVNDAEIAYQLLQTVAKRAAAN